ncbi:MAG: DegT/DnrJ/EryC1/StrS family aminotransferase [bacterium]
MLVESILAKSRTRKNFLPYSMPWISDEEINQVIPVLRSGTLASGPKTKLFENSFIQYIEVRHSIAVNSCMSALHLALSAAGIGKDDEVIIPTINFAHTAYVIIQCGAKPVFADVGDDLNIKVSEIPRLVTSKTKAVIPFDFAGQPAALTEIGAIAKKYNLMVIEDAAHALGSLYRGKKVGVISSLTVFSFCPDKNITTGEGGMIVTNNDELAERIRLSEAVRGCASGTNMNDIQASIGLGQLSRLEQFIVLRRHYADLYTDALRFIPEITLPPINSDSKPSWQLYVVLLNLEKLRINRTQFIEALRYENIGCGVHFIPLHLQPYYQDKLNYKSGDLPNAEWLYERMILLPLYPKMTEHDINDTIQAIRKIVKRMRR